MDAVTVAEGFYYSRQHLIDAGCIENQDDENTFAIHSAEPWSEVSERLHRVWGHGFSWAGPTLIKTSSMKDGRTNYVFKVRRA